MDMRALLARIDPLAAPARRRVFADTARALAGSPQLSALLAELDAVPGLPRAWAATMAVIAGDDTHLRHCLVAADARVAGLAMNHCAATAGVACVAAFGAGLKAVNDAAKESNG